MKTELITYSLKDRGRKHRGQDRDYQTPGNMPSVVSSINSPVTQERVKQRDMHGYFGHGIRQLFGLVPPECKLINGKVVCVEPAFTTTHLKAYEDGTVEHQNEFIDNKYGEKAWKMYKSHVGGFSSAISEQTNPVQFHGFDWVFEPNFTTNRGWTLDAISEDDDSIILDKAVIELANEYMTLVSDTKSAVMDSISSGLNESYQETVSKLALLESELSQMSESYNAVIQENDDLVNMLARQPKHREVSFDQVQPIITSKASFDSLGDDSFLTSELASYEKLEGNDKATIKLPENRLLNEYLDKFR